MIISGLSTQRNAKVYLGFRNNYKKQFSVSKMSKLKEYAIHFLKLYKEFLKT